MEFFIYSFFPSIAKSSKNNNNKNMRFYQFTWMNQAFIRKQMNGISLVANSKHRTEMDTNLHERVWERWTCVHRIHKQVVTVTSLLVEHRVLSVGVACKYVSLVLLTARTQMNTNLRSASLHVSFLFHFFPSPSSILPNCKFLIGNKH